MKRILISIILLFAALSVYSQTDTLHYVDSAYVYDEGDSGNMLISDFTVYNPVIFNIQRNTLVTNRTSGLAFMVGRDTPDADTAKANGSIIAGNYLEYNGEGATNVHGIMDGYNLFEIKHNKIVRMCYGIVCEGTVNTIHSTLATQYNIIQSPRLYGTTTEGQQNKKYYNNTYYNGRHLDGTYMVHFYYNSEAPHNPHATGAEFKNNILYSVIDSVVLMVGEG